VALALLAGLAIAMMLWRARGKAEASSATRRALAIAILIVVLPIVAASFSGFHITWSMPALAGFNFTGGVSVIPEFVAMTLALSLYAAAFIAEIVRAGVAAVPVGQVEAARALGLHRGAILAKVVVPLALRVILPPLGTQYILILKNSSLAAAIAYPDLMLIFGGTVLNQTGQPLEVMLITMATYLLLGLGIGAAINFINARLRLVER
jgi:general L-amino acid transport system permease protein